MSGSTVRERLTVPFPDQQSWPGRHMEVVYLHGYRPHRRGRLWGVVWLAQNRSCTCPKEND